MRAVLRRKRSAIFIRQRDYFCCQNCWRRSSPVADRLLQMRQRNRQVLRFYGFETTLRYTFSRTTFEMSLYFAGGCQNSSPAGKRRIAVSAERAEAYQQLGAGISPLDESWPGFHDRGVAEVRPSGDLSSLYTPMALTLTAFTIAVCLCVVLAFIVIMLVLQVT